jgi:hypothetical protein
MNDIEIHGIFKRIQKSGLPVSKDSEKVFKSLKSSYRQTGGLSQTQIEILLNVENQIFASKHI